MFEVAVSVLLGLAIEIALTVAQPPALSIVRKTADETADRMIRLADRIGPRPVEAPPVVLVDIDDRSWRDWGAPVVAPRDRLAEIVDKLAVSGPLAIVLDVDLSYPDAPAREARLRESLEKYPKDGAPLLLVRALQRSPLGARAPPEQRATVYDAAVADKPNIVFAAPLFERDGDGSVRRWRLFMQTCREGKPAVLPATQVAAAVLARQALAKGAPVSPQAVWGDMTSRLAAFNADNCATTRPIEHGTVAGATRLARPIEVERTDASTRVLYRVAWKDGASALGPAVDFQGAQTPLVSVRPAALVASPAAQAPIPGVAGRIVIVGGSFADSGDWHTTPLGKMPGALVLANAIVAMTVNGTPTEPDFVQRAAISLAIILCAAIAAAWLRPLIAGAVTALFVLAILLLSLRSFQSGIVIDLAVPAVGAAVHDLIEHGLSALRELRRQGFGWFLKKTDSKHETASPTSEINTEEGHPT